MENYSLAPRKSAHVLGEVPFLSKDEVVIATGQLANATVLGKKDDGTFIQLDIAAEATEATEAAAVLFGFVNANDAAVPSLAHTRLTAVDASKLVWPDAITEPQKTAALAELAAINIIAR